MNRKKKSKPTLFYCVLLVILVSPLTSLASDNDEGIKDIRWKRLALEVQKKVVLIAGKPSHAPGSHEHNAGVWLLKKCLDQHKEVMTQTYHNGWPNDPAAFDNADAILLFMDGGGGHPLIQGNHLQEMEKLLKKGVGLLVLHYALGVPKQKGGPELLRWIGGYWEAGFSANPVWNAEFKTIPTHPVMNGIKPFALRDEWYFNLRFADSKWIPLLKATPPDRVRNTEAARQFPGREEVVAWCLERPDGGRSFGFTGGHFHTNWGNENFRKLVLNAVYWTAHVKVPPGGVSSTVTPDDLTQNLDNKKR